MCCSTIPKWCWENKVEFCRRDLNVVVEQGMTSRSLGVDARMMRTSDITDIELQQ